MAGANIKIGATSSEFQRQMKEVTSQLKLVSSECGVASQKAKLFGTAQDQLAAKHKELTAKLQAQNQMMKLHQDRITGINGDIDKQKAKQSELNTKIDEATKKYKDSVEQTGKNSEESKKLKKELEGLKEEYNKNEKAIETNNNKLTDATVKMNNTEKAMLQNLRALNDVNKEIANAKLDKLAEGFDKVSNVSGKASNALKPVSTAIVGLGAASAASSITFEESMAKVSTIADDTIVSYDDMKKSILDLSNQTGISANAIADDVYNAISAGQSTGDAVNFVTESTKLAKAGFAESGQSLDLLTTIMNSYGMEADQVGKVSDNLIQIQNKGKTTVADLSSSMGKIIPTANSMGVSLDQLGAGYALMTSKGIATAETTTYMNSLLNELGKSGTKASEALKKGTGKTFQELTKAGLPLGDVLVMLEKEAKKNKLSLADMFGSAEAGKAALILAGEEGKAFNGLLGDMQNSLGATNTAFEIVDNTTGNKLKKSLNQVKNSGISMGDALAPVIEMIAKAFSYLTTILSSLSTTQLQTIAVIGGGIVAFNIALGAVSKLTGGIRDSIKAYKDIKEHGGKAIEIVKNFGKNAISGAKAVGNFALNLGKTALEFGKTAIQAGIATVKFIAHKVVTIASSIATTAMSVAQAALNFVMSLNPITLIIIAIGALVAAMVVLWNKCEWFRNLVKGMFEQLKVAWKSTLDFFKSIWDWFVGLWNNAVEGFKNAWQSVCDFFKLIWQGVCLYFETVWNFWKGIFDGVVNIIKATWDGACRFFKSLWEGICNTFKTLWEGFKTVFNSVVDGIKTIWNNVCNFFGTAWSRACDGIKSVFTGVKNTVVGIAQSMTNTVIRAINWCITQLNKIKFSVPDWVPLIGGKSWGVNISKVSEVNWLYKGGIIDSPTLLGGGFGVGDAYKGTGRQAEAVIPLDVMYKKMRTIVQEESQNEKDVVLNIENIFKVDGKELKRETVTETIKIMNKNNKDYIKSRGGYSFV